MSLAYDVDAPSGLFRSTSLVSLQHASSSPDIPIILRQRLIVDCRGQCKESCRLAGHGLLSHLALPRTALGMRCFGTVVLGSSLDESVEFDVWSCIPVQAASRHVSDRARVLQSTACGCYTVRCRVRSTRHSWMINATLVNETFTLPRLSHYPSCFSFVSWA